MDHQIKEVHRSHQVNMEHQAKVDQTVLAVDQEASADNNHQVNMVHHQIKEEMVETVSADHHNHTVHLVKVNSFKHINIERDMILKQIENLL